MCEHCDRLNDNCEVMGLLDDECQCHEALVVRRLSQEELSAFRRQWEQAYIKPQHLMNSRLLVRTMPGVKQE